MKNLFVILSLILVISISFTQAQTDTVKTDKVYMLDGTIYDGKVKTIKSDMIIFVEKETGLEYELFKNDIKVVVLANGKPVVFTNTSPVKDVPVVSTVVTPSAVTKNTTTSSNTTRSNTDTESTTTTTQSNDWEPQFSLAGKIGLGIANWSDVETDESTIGFGLNGDLFAGVILDDMFIGIGPHFGWNTWSVSQSFYGYSATATTNVSDFGGGLGASWDGFYMILGVGSGSVSITAEVGGESETWEAPESIGYTRIEFGWYSGYLLGFALQSYSEDDFANNLGRFEFFIGWAL